MAYLKLQGSRALNVIPSDTIGIPKVNQLDASGTTTATSASKLVDSTALFTKSVSVGGIVVNNTNSAIATIVSVDSDAELTLSSNIISTDQLYSTYGAQEQGGCALHISTGGTIKMETPGGDIISLTATSGSFLPIQAVKVFATGTSATGIVAIW
jgi:hypothetical protein